MAPNTRRLLGIALLITAVAYGMYRQRSTVPDVGGTPDGQPVE